MIAENDDASATVQAANANTNYSVIGQAPAVAAATPATWMSLMGRVIDPVPVQRDRDGLAAVTRVGRHQPDDALAVPVVGPVHESHHPGPGLFLAAEGNSGVIRSVLDRAEQRFRKGGVIANRDLVKDLITLCFSSLASWVAALMALQLSAWWISGWRLQRRSGLLRRLSSDLAASMTMGMEQPVEAALGPDIKTPSPPKPARCALISPQHLQRSLAFGLEEDNDFKKRLDRSRLLGAMTMSHG